MKKFMVMILMIGLLFSFSASQAWAGNHVAFASGTGSQAAPPGGVETDGTCQLYLELVPMTAVKYKLQCFNITGITAAHIHAGKAQDNGSVLAPLFTPTDATGAINGTLSEGMIDGADIVGVQLGDFMTLIRSDFTYVNVHTAANPAGEVRGQITGRVNDGFVVSASYTATATGSQELIDGGPDGVTTDATCFASFRASGLADDRLRYKLKCWNITGVTQAHIHAGSAQENGAPVVFLFPSGDPTDDVNGLIRRGTDKSKGSVRAEDLINTLEGMSIADLAAILRADGAYLNVHTDANPAGEVRGQISFVDTIGF